MKENSNRDIHIDAIRRRFGISLAAVYGYNNLHMKEIQNIGEIFNLKESNPEKTLALLYMLYSDEQDPVIGRFRKETGLDNAQYNSPDILIDKYGIMLVSALIYNPRFYAMAMNYHGAVGAGLAITKLPESEPEEVPLHTETKNRNRIIPFRITTRIVLAAAAVFAVVFFITILARTGGTTGRRINNDWITGLSAPQWAQNGIAFVSENDGARIGIKSPLMGTAMSANNKPADLSAAVSYYTKAIRVENNNAALYVNRGIAYTLQGYVDLAISDFNKAIEIDPYNTSAYYNRAVAYTGSDNVENAIADLLTIISINPTDNEAYYALGVLYFRQYENDEAKPRALLEMTIDTFSHIKDYRDADIILDYLSRLL